MKLIKIIITGGGSGGHLFPGIAIADELLRLHPKTKVLFVGSKTPLEKKIMAYTKYPHFTLPIVPLTTNKPLLKIISQIPLSLLIAKNILKGFKPHLVISVGGYSAAPTSILAKTKKIPLVICEQNILPGKTNRLLFKFADRIYTSFKKTVGLENNTNAMFFGNPLRRDIIDIRKNLHLKSTVCGKKQKFTILVLGGSQGAKAINITVINALKHITSTNNLQFIHQTGPKDEQTIKKKYLSKKISAEVKKFFNDIATCYAKADLVICRAGATTLAELTAIGKCSILIPYPFSAGNHQLFNAQFLASSGAAELLFQENLTGLNLAKYINKFINNPKKVATMASKARAIGMNKAAELITTDIYKILEKKGCI